MENPMALEFRKATPEDLDAALALVAEAVVKMDAGGIPQWDALYPDRTILAEDVAKDELIVGTLDGELACIYVVNSECDEDYKNGAWQYPDSDFRVVHRLCVSPRFQNRGVGRAVCLHIAETLKKQGVETIRLDAFTKNPSALRLYEGLGCKIVGTADWRKGRFYLMEATL